MYRQIVSTGTKVRGAVDVLTGIDVIRGPLRSGSQYGWSIRPCWIEASIRFLNRRRKTG